MDFDTLAELESRINHADKRYGNFASSHEAIGVCLEEWNELCDAVRGNDLDHARAECLDLAAVCIRFAMQANNLQLRVRSVK